jgi:hypothetical protein
MSALARWDGFLAQIEGRHKDVIAEAEAAARAAIAELAAGGDHLPLAHQLSAIDARLRDLETKIADTWHAKVEDAIFADGHSPEVRDQQFQRGDDLKDRLDEAREELPIRVLAELARQRHQRARAAHGPVPCAHCGAPLDAPFSFRALELPCGACKGRITLWQPPELMLSVGAIGTHPISQEAAQKEWRAMRAAERAKNAHRSPTPLAALKAYEQAQIAYWRVYLKARAWFEPELARDPKMEIEKRMEQWYVYSAEHEQRWVEAGRPREPL